MVVVLQAMKFDEQSGRGGNCKICVRLTEHSNDWFSTKTPHVVVIAHKHENLEFLFHTA